MGGNIDFVYLIATMPWTCIGGDTSSQSQENCRAIVWCFTVFRYCAKSLGVKGQFSDDGRCFYDAWFINASANCPLNTSAVGGHAGVTTSPPAVEPNPIAPGHHHGGHATSLIITFTLGGPLSASATTAAVRRLGTVVMRRDTRGWRRHGGCGRECCGCV